MVAAQTDKFKKVGASTVTSLAAPGRAIGATSITVGSTTNYPTDTGIVIAIRVVDSTGNLVAGTYTEYTATVTSGTSLAISASPIYGTDQVYSAGSSTQVYIPVSYRTHNDLVDASLVQHNQDGTHGVVTATSVTATGTVQGAIVISTGDIQRRSISTETIDSEYFFDYVASGCVLTGTGYGSTLGWSLTAGVVYIGGKRLTVAATTGTVTDSKDTYFDVLDSGSGTVATLIDTGGNIVANNAASPALAASSVRIGIIVSGASNIASVAAVNQGQEDRVLPIASSIPYTTTDSLGNLICPRDPTRKTLGYRQIITTSTNTTQADVTGLTCPVIVPAGRKVKITVDCQSVSSNVGSGGGSYTIYIMEGGTQLSASTITGSGSGYTIPYHREAQPASISAGLHTYKIQSSHSVGWTVTINAASNSPTFIRVELV